MSLTYPSDYILEAWDIEEITLDEARERFAGLGYSRQEADDLLRETDEAQFNDEIQGRSGGNG